MIVVPGRIPTILVGNESVAYASGTPYPIDVIRQSKFSLNGQPDPDPETVLRPQVEAFDHASRTACHATWSAMKVEIK